MSKRSPSPLGLAVAPLKLARTDNVWDLIPDSDNKAKEFKPVEGGPKTKLLKSMVLNFKPRVDVSVSLYGCNPEVRFTSDNEAFVMTGDEFIQMTGTHFGVRAFQRVRMEPLEGEEGGFRLARYERTPSGIEHAPVLVFELNSYAAKRLKTKVNELSNHVAAIMSSEDVIMTMCVCVITAYRSQYELSNYVTPINEHFHELSRIVEVYVPGVAIVKAFLDKLYTQKMVSKFNHYNLLATVLAQKELLAQLIRVNDY